MIVGLLFGANREWSVDFRHEMFNKRGRIIYTVGTQLATWNEGRIISSEYDLRTWEDRLSWNAECGGT